MRPDGFLAGSTGNNAASVLRIDVLTHDPVTNVTGQLVQVATAAAQVGEA
jgi:hypothetical protein